MQASDLLERQLARLGGQYIQEYAAAATTGMYNYEHNTCIPAGKHVYILEYPYNQFKIR